MMYTDPINELFGVLYQQLKKLNDLERNAYFEAFESAESLDQRYAVTLQLSYAANSKELRDTSDPDVHAELENINETVRQLNSLFRMDLFPSSSGQREYWKRTTMATPGGRFAIRDDGSLKISVLDSALSGSMLRVKRYWSHVSNYDGTWTDFSIRLDAEQAKAFVRSAANIEASRKNGARWRKD